MKIPSDIDFKEYLAFVGKQESQEIYWASHWEETLVGRAKHGVRVIGQTLPWSKTHSHVRLREGELSIWAGINGHKKSMLLGQVMLWLSTCSSVCIASLEMRPEVTLERMIKQAAGCDPSPEFVSQFAQWSDEKIAIYDQLDTVEADRILGMVWYSARELGCKHVVIDSLTKCGFGVDDYSAHKDFINRLSWCAKSNRIHIHLVCHVRKGARESDRPNKFDVVGGGDVTNLADNVFMVWKDKEREQVKRKQDQRAPITPKEVEILERPDQILCVEKQRHGEWEGPIKLWFHDRSLQFLGEDKNQAMPFDIGFKND